MIRPNPRISLWLPVLLLIYLESLRAAMFYALHWVNSDILTFITALVVFYLVLDENCSDRLITGLLETIILISVPVFILNGITISPEEVVVFLGKLIGGGIPAAFIDAGFVAIYGLTVFVITSFIIERSSAREIFFLGTLLMAVCVLTSDQGVLKYLPVNFISGLGLAGQLYLLGLEMDPRVRLIENTGLQKIWASVSMAMITSISCLALFVPASGETKLVSVFKQIPPQISVDTSGTDFWSRLTNFEDDGVIELDSTPVMSVKSPRAFYWRGESLDRYTGRGWVNSMAVRVVSENDFKTANSVNASVDSIEQTFYLNSEYTSDVLYFGSTPAKIELMNTDSSLRMELLTDDAGNFFNPQVEPKLSYQVLSHVTKQNTADSTGNQYPADIKAKYLQLPKIPPRVQNLARQLTKDADTPYKKAVKIERYLSSNYPYDFRITATPKDRDLTDYFLFDLKKGYCTYHSTAMVVLLRSVGIPARWVTGFTTGEFNPDKGVYEVTMLNAHAWVEAYISNFGWVPFEPTAGFRLPDQTNVDKKTNAEGNDMDTDPEQRASNTADVLDFDGTLGKIMGEILFAVIAAIILMIFIRRRKKIRINSTENVEEIYKLFLQLLSNKGYYKNAIQTPFEFADSLAKTGEFDADFADIMRITEGYVRKKFSHEQYDEGMAQEVKEAFERLVDKWKGKSRD